MWIVWTLCPFAKEKQKEFIDNHRRGYTCGDGKEAKQTVLRLAGERGRGISQELLVSSDTKRRCFVSSADRALRMGTAALTTFVDNRFQLRLN